jgi:hypothetical protein
VIEKDIAERPVACGSQTDSPNAAIQVRVPQAASRKQSPYQPPWRDFSTLHLLRILRDVSLGSFSFPCSILCLERVDVRRTRWGFNDPFYNQILKPTRVLSD